VVSSGAAIVGGVCAHRCIRSRDAVGMRTPSVSLFGTAECLAVRISDLAMLLHFGVRRGTAPLGSPRFHFGRIVLCRRRRVYHFASRRRRVCRACVLCMLRLRGGRVRGAAGRLLGPERRRTSAPRRGPAAHRARGEVRMGATSTKGAELRAGCARVGFGAQHTCPRTASRPHIAHTDETHSPSALHGE